MTPLTKKRNGIILKILNEYGIHHIHHMLMTVDNMCARIVYHAHGDLFNMKVNPRAVIRAIENTDRYSDDFELMESDNGVKYIMAVRD